MGPLSRTFAGQTFGCPPINRQVAVRRIPGEPVSAPTLTTSASCPPRSPEIAIAWLRMCVSCVYVCVCSYACMCLGMCACMCINMPACMRAWKYLTLSLSLSPSLYIIYIYICTIYTYHICIHTYVSMLVRVYACVHVCMHS